MPHPNLVVVGDSDMGAPFASGSGVCDATIIAPCSMGMVGRIAHGISDDLIARAADVALKERQRLILCPRETPLSVVHLRNLLAVSEAGAIVAPAMPNFYTHPATIEDLVDTVAWRVLALAGLDLPERLRWGTPD
jgi:4-hydroxy-3-polyprenylbenzoate decarboxylase